MPLLNIRNLLCTSIQLYTALFRTAQILFQVRLTLSTHSTSSCFSFLRSSRLFSASSTPASALLFFNNDINYRQAQLLYNYAPQIQPLLECTLP